MIVTVHLADERAVVARLAHRLVEVGDCWEYEGCRHKGYGRARIDGRRHLVHRWVLTQILGREPEPGALHRCNNRACFRPTHLYEGDQADNAADRDAAGTTARGERHGKAKLTVDLVRQLRAERAAGLSYRKLGRKYGITHQSARAAAIGQNWRLS